MRCGTTRCMAPIKKDGLQEPELVIIPSTYRFIVNPLMDYILELGESESGAEGRGAAAGAGGAALVGERAAQSAGAVAEAAAAAEGESEDCGGEYSLVSVRVVESASIQGGARNLAYFSMVFSW